MECKSLPFLDTDCQWKQQTFLSLCVMLSFQRSVLRPLQYTSWLFFPTLQPDHLLFLIWVSQMGHDTLLYTFCLGKCTWFDWQERVSQWSLALSHCCSWTHHPIYLCPVIVCHPTPVQFSSLDSSIPSFPLKLIPLSVGLVPMIEHSCRVYCKAFFFLHIVI